MSLNNWAHDGKYLARDVCIRVTKCPVKPKPKMLVYNVWVCVYFCLLLALALVTVFVFLYSCKRVTLIVCEIEVESKCEEQCVALIETGLYLITYNPVSTVSVGIQLAGKSWWCCLKGGMSWISLKRLGKKCVGKSSLVWVTSEIQADLLDCRAVLKVYLCKNIFGG